MRARKVAVRGARAKKTRGEGMGVTALLAQINRRCSSASVVARALCKRAARAGFHPPKVVQNGAAWEGGARMEKTHARSKGMPIVKA